MSLDSRGKGQRQAQLFVITGISALNKTLSVGRFLLWSPGQQNKNLNALPKRTFLLLSGKLIALPSADRQFATREA